MHPWEEAFARIDQRYDPRVLEPSPPAVEREPWFADDPTARGEQRDDLPILSPVPTGDVLWDDLALADDELAEWCAERWLGAYRRLVAPPPRLAETRDALRRLAEEVISPTRQRANGRIGLRWTRGGFGTPFFGNDVQIRVAGDVLTIEISGQEHSGRLVSLRDAAEFVGHELTRFDAASEGDLLAVDVGASHWLGELFGFGTSVLEHLRAETAEDDEPGRVQLWPERFDLCLEIGGEADGRRATFGVSPGDAERPQPYLYVLPAAAATLAVLPFAELLDAADQRAQALAFYRAALAGR